MSSTHDTFERNRQDREALAGEALELREQRLPYSSVAKKIGVSKTRAESLVKDSGRMNCGRCGEKLVNPVPEDECGWCIEEQGLAA